MSFLYLFLVGILIGTAMIIPGVSGAVLAVIFGVYDKMIDALNNLFKNFKNNFLFLCILGLGILVGAVWFSNVLMFLYNTHEVVTKFCFIGLILGGVPFLFKEIRIKSKENVNYIVIVLTSIISILLFILSKNTFFLDIQSSSFTANICKLFLAGIIYSVGKVMPGISGSFLLIIIGMYEFVLSVMAHPFSYGLKEIEKLIPFIVGLIVGIIVLLKLMNYLLNKKFALIYSLIIGFVIGSIPALIPLTGTINNYIAGLFMMFLCFVLSFELTK